MHPTPKFQEKYSSKIPALLLLNNLGWGCLSPKTALAMRNHSKANVVLEMVLREVLAAKTFLYAGKERHLSAKAVDYLVAELMNPNLNESLVNANEKIYNHLLYGITVIEFVEGKKISCTIPIIDWENIENNRFHFTEEFDVANVNGSSVRTPDIVCFVNGLPLAVIEGKRPDGKQKSTIEEGISQTIRNQRPNEIPHLFAYAQLVLSINGTAGRYATCGTPAKFWSAWREEEFSELEMANIKNSAISPQDLTAILPNSADQQWYQQLIAQGRLAVTGQDQLLISLLSPARLLEMIRYFTLFDHKEHIRVVARYPQVFGVKRLLNRVSTQNEQGGRNGGVIWHTTGSGKSFTMVFFSKALLLHPALKQCRIVVVTDRVDLENQLSRTFYNSGELATKRDRKNAMATTGKRLAEQIGQGNERIIFSLIQKFNTAIEQPNCFNPSENIIVLIDEGHRTQGGENHIAMRRALPNASFVAFTGTPLLKDDETTQKFGKIIHAYTMQRAVEDKSVTPLLYEERIPELEVNKQAIDNWFERITKSLSEQQKADLKRKFARKRQIYQADERIHLIALDIAYHLNEKIEQGLKGQLACESKVSAIRYKQYLDEVGLFESAIVISPPDSREGNSDIDEQASDEVVRWWNQNVQGNEEVYTQQVLNRFADPDSPLRLLIVVDKLLTGFDEPSNAVLYIDKPLKQHNLIQAIARVNRLHKQKEYGLLIDYRGILKELDTTIAKYQDLASRTQGGYDIDDIEGLYRPMRNEYLRLLSLYQQLWAVFATVENKADIEQLRRVLMPNLVADSETSGLLFDKNSKIRDDFYRALTDFNRCLQVALQSEEFYQDQNFTDSDRTLYKETAKQFSYLRRLVKQDSGEQIDYSEYADQVEKLIDKHVVGLGVKEPEGICIYAVNKMGKAEIKQWDDTKTRNEADKIRSRIARSIELDLNDDPYAKARFSELLQQAIEEAEALFDNPMKQYLLFQEFEEQVAERKLAEIPDRFADNHSAQAYFGVFKTVLPETLAQPSEQERWVELAFEVDRIVLQAVAEHSLSLEQVEKEISKQLLPMLFKLCQSIGSGMLQAKEIVKRIIQIVRIGHK
ncbi:type I restriction endonuclease subunit R [Basfia succiniciproducens]|uniref:Type I restriction enzyme endonuclease subunit n=1 Tax=Basfia succiniciproducens TaxID=653940 RepID=A0A1G5AAZ4_9PAST|nr:HsdR family type I site-specific deoxyribonuclease [Basfia succiniciproducens]QIM68439.1 DEAD/DEAH box helicase [Basfia succiniciproducens]SCX75064.1 type I restriction enzyme, R subunit [Basfia succiniciproducens]